MKTLTLLSVPFITFSIACAPPQPTVDLGAVKKSLLDRDAAWSKTVKDAGAFASYFGEGATWFPPDGPMVQGAANIKDFATNLVATPGFSVSWKAADADVSSSGDMGYTYGAVEMTMQSPEGKPLAIRGKYVTVWKKQASGEWKVVADIFNANGPPTPAGQ